MGEANEKKACEASVLMSNGRERHASRYIRALSQLIQNAKFKCSNFGPDGHTAGRCWGRDIYGRR